MANENKMYNLQTQAEPTNQLQNYLRRLKADVDVEYGAKYTFIKDDIEVSSTLRKFCEQGADLDYLEKERGFSCIPNVFWSRNLIQFFVERGLNVNAQDENGDTALNLILSHSSIDLNSIGHKNNVVKFLLDHFADPNIPNLRGDTALFILTRKYFYDHKYSEILLAKGADPKFLNKDDESLLHLQSNTHLLDIKLCLTYKGENVVNFRTSKRLYSQTPLMLACRRGYFEYCKLLIELGSDINVKDLQGYTALHHAVIDFDKRRDSRKCAEYLVDIGADTTIKSTSGKDVYELAIQRGYVFTNGAEPAKQAEIFEMSGARKIIRDRNMKECLNLWENGMKVCETFGIQPSKEFLSNYHFLKDNLNHPNLELQMYVSSMDTVSRLSEGGKSKFWNLLAFAPAGDHKKPTYVFETLNYLSKEFDRVGDFASFEEIDFQTLARLAVFFKSWLDSFDSKIELTENGISHLHSIVNLTIACLEKRIRETESRKVLSDYYVEHLYYYFLKALSLIRTRRFSSAIPEIVFRCNERLLRSLISIDPVDKDGNTLMHLALSAKRTFYDGNFIDILFDIGLIDLGAKNEVGLEPVQVMCQKIQDRFEGRFLADRGAHFDAKNSRGDLILMNGRNLSFCFDTLQCMCARVLVQSLVPFRNRVPKRMVDFILMH